MKKSISMLQFWPELLAQLGWYDRGRSADELTPSQFSSKIVH